MSTLPLSARGIAVAGRLSATDLDLEPGQLTLLVGSNGSGKTTLIHRLAGIGGAVGAVSLGGLAIESLPPQQRLGRIALLPANREVAWPLKARDLVALGLGNRADPGRIRHALDRVDASPFAGRRIDQLSTGERSRVLLARALVASPTVLLLDEPAAHLDPAWQIKLLELLRAETGRGTAILASIHDLALARAFADRILVMEQGRVVSDGTPETALPPEVLEKIFGVRWDACSGWVRT